MASLQLWEISSFWAQTTTIRGFSQSAVKAEVHIGKLPGEIDGKESGEGVAGCDIPTWRVLWEPEAGQTGAECPEATLIGL